MTDDPFDLARFVSAQADAWPIAKRELRAGRKRGHWMWMIFPQIAGLGFSDMSRRYAIRSGEEARAYLAHPVLGPRLREAAELMLALPGDDARAVLGEIDAVKFGSSMTLFDAIAPDDLFAAALARFNAGERDAMTRRLLG